MCSMKTNIEQGYASIWFNERNHSSVFLYEQYRSFRTTGWKPSVEVAAVEEEDNKEKKKRGEEKRDNPPPTQNVSLVAH